MNARSAFLMTAAALLCANGAARADDSGSKVSAAEAQAYAALDETVLAAPIGRGFSGTNADDDVWRFDVSYDKDKAVAGIEWELSSQIQTPRHLQRHAVFNTAKVRITAPIGEEDGFATFADLDGIASGFGIDANYSWRVSNIEPLWTLSRNPQYLDLCKRSGQSMGICSSTVIRRAALNDPDLRRDFEEFDKSIRGWMQTYSVGARGGQADFSYITQSLDKSKVGRTAWGAQASVTLVPPSRQMQIGFGLDYQKSYKAAKSRVICPSSDAQPIFCVQGSYGPPTRETSRQVWVGVKRSSRHFAYQLRATYDVDARQYGVDMPIYLVRNSVGNLTAGIRLGWTEETDFTAAIFVSKPFEF